MLIAVVIVFVVVVLAAMLVAGRIALKLIPSTLEPKLRELDDRMERRLGEFGETVERRLADRLPPAAYAMQHRFAGGEIVDAVVRVGQLIPVDSKFPLDNYHRIVEAENDDERQLHEKAFARDVKGHIDAIAAKYIRPAEGTYDFAFMYIPVEAVYYELSCGKTGALLQYAPEKPVFPVSPTPSTTSLPAIV